MSLFTKIITELTNVICRFIIQFRRSYHRLFIAPRYIEIAPGRYIQRDALARIHDAKIARLQKPPQIGRT